MKIEPLIVVKDVEASSRFYQELLQCKSGHGGNHYETLIKNKKLILQLHHQNEKEHPGMWRPGIPPGNGVILWFRATDFQQTVNRAKKLKAKVVKEPHINPNAQQSEMWLKDPDGYLIVIASNPGDA